MSTDADRKINEAFERLTQGHPEITNGALTVSNICAEAGISRASYYRSPLAAAIKRRLLAPETARPEVENLREQVKELKKIERSLRSEHAAQIRDLKDTIKTYANQIQALALRTAELEDDNHRLKSATGGVTSLATRR